MDTRILALLLLISVAGSFADLRSPLSSQIRARRNGLQETDRHLVSDLAGVSRTKRESGDSTSTKGATVPATSTTSPTDATSSDANSESTSTQKAGPRTVSSPNSNRPTTSFTPDPSSTTSNTFEPSSRTASASTSVPPTKSKPTTPTSGPPVKSATPKPKFTRSGSSTAPSSTASSEAATASTTNEPPNSGETTDDPASTTASPNIGSRFNPDDEMQEPNRNSEPEFIANQGPSGGNPMNPGFPSFQFPPFFVPNFAPSFSYPSNANGDPTFNSIPGAVNNNAWMGPSNAGGFASSFASASASAGASAGAPGSSNYNTSPLVNRGGFPNQPNTAIVPTAAIEPNTANMPNTVIAGGYGYGGDEPNSSPFAFPGYNLALLQKQMEEHFKQLQAQFQKQQQAFLEASNRINAPEPYSSSGPHTAYAGASLGPGGGYQTGEISPVAPGVVSRFGEDVPPPSGNTYGVFASSSSQAMVGPDGKVTAHKSATTGVNDNGKVTFRTVKD